jgi:hypothetical protein
LVPVKKNHVKRKKIREKPLKKKNKNLFEKQKSIPQIFRNPPAQEGKTT